MSMFYRPSDGAAADFIPFYWKGEYHIFYLKDYRDEAGHGPGVPWFHLVTRDFVRFDDWGEAIARGPAGSQDVWIFTGSVMEHGGTFHIFYTGHNHHMADLNQPNEVILHAVSRDLCTWAKDPDFRFPAPAGYEPHDWRDPFVFWNEEAQEFWMLLAVRLTSVGPKRNRGCTALATSRDLKYWTVREPLWAPDEYFTHECPDLFRLGEWWYLVYSTFSERSVTHYRMSRSLQGPWLAPDNDTFDAWAFYAAKTAGVGVRRHVFGWLPTRADEKDDGAWQWGGNLVVHEVRQRADGSLAVRVPQRVLKPFVNPVPLAPRSWLGQWATEGDAYAATAVGRFSALGLGALPQECRVQADVIFGKGTASCGLLLRADAGLDNYYQVRLEPANQRIVFDRWPRLGDQAFMLERPLAMKPGRPVRLILLVDGTCLVVYADDRVALSARMYDQRAGALGAFVTEGVARFERVSLRVR
jgi:beta-fructofuranosidase